MGHGLLLLLGLLVKDFTVTLKQGRYQAHFLGYMGFGSKITFAWQRNVKQQRREKMKLVGYVLAKLQPSTQVL